MYKQFFGLRENPFNVNPDPKYLYLTAQTRGTLDELRYGIETRQGLMLLTGEVGTGKTTLLNRLLDWLHQQKRPQPSFSTRVWKPATCSISSSPILECRWIRATRATP